MKSSSSFMELRNKRKFETSDNNEESKAISTTDVDANVSQDTIMVTKNSKKFDFFNHELIDFHQFKNRDKIHQESITRKALWFKPDSMKIIQDKSKVNLCLFYSMLNRLPTFDQKLAFNEYYTGSDPSTKFLIYNKTYSTRDHENLGFHSSEIIDWLKYLQRKAFIINFVF